MFFEAAIVALVFIVTPLSLPALARAILIVRIYRRQRRSAWLSLVPADGLGLARTTQEVTDRRSASAAGVPRARPFTIVAKSL